LDTALTTSNEASDMANYVDAWKKELADVEEKLYSVKKGESTISAEDHAKLKAHAQELHQKIVDAEAKGD
jgi:predicted  nucleic acid-binding Zn-ribbon protein